MACNHKPKSHCKVAGCKKNRQKRKNCEICGKKRYRSTCRKHRADGSKKPYSKSHKRCNNRRKALKKLKETGKSIKLD